MPRGSYGKFREDVVEGLRGEDQGLTWAELREKAGLKYDRPCYTWIGRMEKEDGLRRERRGNRVYWMVDPKR
jgi:hypothetical protein